MSGTMATSQKLTDKFLTCSVCMDVFDDPCTLGCYHTFCRKCVVRFTKTQPDAVDAKSIPCPFCRKWTKASNPEKQVDEWVAKMKPSFLIQGLIDSFGPGTKDTTYCSYCKEEGETTPATAWCSVCDESLCARCARMHKRIVATQEHEIFGLSDDIRSKRKVMCTVHPSECVEFLCKDCNKAICQKCCILQHRKCDSVVTIESALLFMKSQLKKTREFILTKVSDAKAALHAWNSQLTDLATMHSRTESEIKAASQKARDAIAAKENRLLCELNDITQDQLGQLQVHLKTGEMAVQMYQQQAELIDQSMKTQCEVDVYEMYQSSESFQNEDTYYLKEEAVSKFSFRKDTDKFARQLKELQLGEIVVKYGDRLQLKATSLLQNTVDTRLPTDKNQCYPFDVTVLDVNGIDTVVITDCNNSCVKSFYRADNIMNHSKLSLASDPWSLTRLNNNKVAVTVPESKQIIKVEVNPELKLLSTMQTEHSYWGITVLTPTTIATSTRDPPSVDILDMSGTVLKSVTSRDASVNMLKNPSFITTTKTGNILVSDNGTRSVLCLTQDGDVVFNYSPTGDRALHEPVGIAVAKTGDILVGDCSLHSVLHLTETGEFVRNILTSEDGLALPCGLCIDKNGRLALSLLGKDFQIVQMYMLGR